MSEPWETSLYPIIKEYLENNIDEDIMSDDEINRLNNKICQRFDKFYKIEKR